MNAMEVFSREKSEAVERNEEAIVVAKKEKQSKEVELQAYDLPSHLWENILARLPVARLFRMLSVCKAWKSMVKSESFMMVYRRVPPQDIFFALFADYQRNVIAAYDPFENKWVVIPLIDSSCTCYDTCSRLCSGVISCGGLVVAMNRKESLVVCNLFTKIHKILPPMIPMSAPYVVAMLVLNNHYKILAVSTGDAITSQVYDSQTNSWRMSGGFDGRFAMVGNAAYLDGFLFCLSHPDSLLAFDIDAGSWHMVEVSMPPIVCPHILEHEGSLILIGGIEENGLLKRICIWELDESVKEWHILCTMPDHFFSKFSQGNLDYFSTVAIWSKICFYRFYKNCRSVIFMYDLSENKWWELPPCPLDNRACRPSWFGLALEPRLDALV